mgnify:CR=1 FL=1
MVRSEPPCVHVRNNSSDRVVGYYTPYNEGSILVYPVEPPCSWLPPLSPSSSLAVSRQRLHLLSARECKELERLPLLSRLTMGVWPTCLEGGGEMGSLPTLPPPPTLGSLPCLLFSFVLFGLGSCLRIAVKMSRAPVRFVCSMPRRRRSGGAVVVLWW